MKAESALSKKTLNKKPLNKKPLNKNPVRVDLAGGLLDIWPVYLLVPDCYVVNFSLPIFTLAEVSFSTYLDTIDVEVLSPSFEYRKTFSSVRELCAVSNSKLSLLQKHLSYWRNHKVADHKVADHKVADHKVADHKVADHKVADHKVVRPAQGRSFIRLQSGSPVGAGLGGSSSLCVSLARAFSFLFGKSMSKKELLFYCRDLETCLLGAPAGVQDYIPAIESELNSCYIINCGVGTISWTQKKIPEDFFKDHFLLVDTGKPHHSGSNNWKSVKKIVEKDRVTMDGVYRLRDQALKTKEICESENWLSLFDCINREQKLRSEFFSNWLPSSVSPLIEILREAGATAFKLCGAGGGGSLLVLATDKIKKQNIYQKCQQVKIPVIFS